MTRAWWLLVLAVAGSWPVAARAGEPRVVVLPLAARGAGSADVAEQVTTALTHHISRLPGFQVTSVREVESTLAQAARQQVAGCDSSACAVEIAAAMDAEEIVFGSVGQVGDTWMLAVQRVRARDARVLGRALEQVPRGRESELLLRLPGVVQALFPAAPPPPAASAAPPASPAPAATEPRRAPHSWWWAGPSVMGAALAAGAAGALLVGLYSGTWLVDVAASGGRAVQGAHALPLPLAAAATGALGMGVVGLAAAAVTLPLGAVIAALGWVLP